MIEPGAPGDPLIIREVEFLGGLAEVGGWRPGNDLPEIAFAGRSNVGKSSLINTLLHRKHAARVSRTPGKTREVNFFRINNRFVLVDLPGYGYARVSKERRAAWRPLIERYLKHNNHLRGIALLLDSRRDPSEDDLQMLEFLSAEEAPAFIVVTKVDKLGARERAERLASIARSAGVQVDDLLPFSSTTGEGRNELAAAILHAIEEPPRVAI